MCLASAADSTDMSAADADEMILFWLLLVSRLRDSALTSNSDEERGSST